MSKHMDVGRSWRTYAKHELMNSVVGQEVGAVNRPNIKMNKVDRLVWFDLTAGDAAPVDSAAWHRACSPGILAHHATTSFARKPVAIQLYEIQPATFDRLLRNLSEQLPQFGYVADGGGRWRHGSRVTVEAFNSSGHVASVDMVGNRDAVLVFNDPNAITEWAMRDTFAHELASRAWCFRSLSTMGCNTAGIKRLDLRERLAWFDLIDTQEVVLPHYRDLLLAAIEKDEAQWAYLLSTSAKETWRKQGESVVASAFKAALKRMPEDSRGRTAATTWFRSSPTEFRETKLQLFLTRSEREALRGREKQWLTADREARLALLSDTTPVENSIPTLFSLDDLGGDRMTTLGPYNVHPFADEFPLIEGAEFEELVTDIKRQGLRQPIVLNHDETVLIDGRNRYRACEAAGLDPVFETLPARYTEAMILDYIVSTNIERRHLSAGQKALVALSYEAALASAVKEAEASRKASAVGDQSSRNGNAPSTLTGADLHQSPQHTPSAYERKSATRAAKVVGASGRAVQQAKALQRDAPDLAQQVRSGQIALDAADRQRKQRIAAMPKPEPVPARPGPVMLTLRTHNGEEVPYPKPSAKATFNETRGEGISWAGWSWNPVTGCLHGCDYCYAREIATNERFKGAFPVGFTPLFHHERLDAPANTVIPEQFRNDAHDSPCGTQGCKVCEYRRVFVCSMADLYGRWVPDEWIDQVHASMLASPEWQYILLTKFPARYVGLQMPPGAWIGTSVDEQKRVRIAEDAFRKIDGGAVKWLSLEPLKEPLEFTDLSVFDWVVIGAQTETRQPDGTVPAFAPPFEWVARIVAQAREAGCKVHLKPNLINGRPGMTLPDEYPEAAS